MTEQDLETLLANPELNKFRNSSDSSNRIEVMPKPAFVVKTHLTQKTDTYPKDLKLFINLCQSPEIPAPAPLSSEEFEIAYAQEDEEKLKVPISLNELKPDVDKAGRTCIVIDACVHSSAASRCEDFREYRDFLVRLVISHVENRCGVKLSRDYVLPKLRSKGTLRPHLVARPRRPVIEESSPSPPATSASNASHTSSQNPTSNTVRPIRAKLRAPTYRVTCEPPDGRPEYMVIEIDLPGANTTASATLDLEPHRLIFTLPPTYSLEAALPWPADTAESEEAAGAEFDRGKRVLTVTVRVLEE
ncbi:PIH1-domain-containing protein [Gonapodya prolifera JEL478]|uniref:PIH1 domain-containing protein 1 n=1 Tax=Gonapodya prolifera (strain JEL478) TaxID=1344416 RepID=A0A139AQ46_GONPJ|nr:PIH1-domain-containing protein [Gonapodya prolifera JEL478]|eukprot:KXS18870.1 PIH1-domain-containing protein [Gonapodya prolifera JEL478]